MLGLCASATAVAQTGTHPDLSGVWMAIGVRNPDGGPSTPRYSEEGRARLDAFIAQFSEVPEAGGACVGSGMPGVMLSTVSYPIEFVQNESRILMVAELETQVRRVFIDGRGHPDGVFPTGTGHSIGTWEGDTLVIETTNYSENSIGLSMAVPSGTGKRVVERLRLSEDRKQLEVETRVEDPEYLAAPAAYAGAWLYRPSMQHSNERCDLDVARRFLDD